MPRRPAPSFLVVPLLVAAASLAACAPVLPARSTAIDRVELVKSATFDHGCPEDDIRVLGEEEAAGAPRFLLDVCGTRRTYKRIGTMYVDADRDGV